MIYEYMYNKLKRRINEEASNKCIICGNIIPKDRFNEELNNFRIPKEMWDKILNDFEDHGYVQKINKKQLKLK